MLNKLRKLTDLLNWEQRKTEWNLKTPKQKWAMIYGMGDFMARLIGITVYTDMKTYWHSLFPGVIAVIYLILSSYTIWFHFNEGDIGRCLFCTCASAIVFTYAPIYWKTIGPDRSIVRNIIGFGGKYIYMDDNEPTKYNTMCEKMIARLMEDIIAVVIAIIISFSTSGLGTIYANVFQHIRVTLVGTEIPFFKHNPDIRYVLIMCIESVIAYFGAVAAISIEMGACFALNIIATIPELIKLESDELEKELISNGMSVRAKARVRHILMQLQDIDGYIREILDAFYIRFFIGPFLFTYAVSASILGQLIFDYPGYGAAMCNYILLICFCHQGDRASESNQKMAREIYNMPWYLLSADRQRDVSNAINMVQHRAVVTLGPFGELNLETASDLTKSIGRFTMMLLKVFK